MIGIVAPDGAAQLVAAIRERLLAAGLEAWDAQDLTHPAWPDTEFLIDVAVRCGLEEMARAPRLRGVVSPLLGYDFIDVAEATRRGVAVVNGEVAENRESMAEATIMLILALLYRLHEAEAALRDPAGGPLPRARMLKGKTVGVIGLGGIAQAVIARLRAWECRMLVYSRAGSAPDGTTLRSLDDLMAASDVVVVATSLSPDTHHLITRERLFSMKSGAILVNTARGPIIDETALVELLQGERIAGAALDVFEVEPLPADHPLRSLRNVILTPHAVGHTAESGEAVPARAVENILALAAGNLPESCRNPAVEAVWAAR